jgi:methyl-accepting chemotaxis protein
MNNMNASSAEEQSVSAKVITDNIQVISDISTGSVANVESNQRTAEALQSVADSLKEKMKRYRAATGT